MGSWIYGFMGLWAYGLMGSWIYRLIVYGFMGLWAHGFTIKFGKGLLHDTYLLQWKLLFITVEAA
jgi:hypothetical protein